MHGFERCPENIDPVNLIITHAGNGKIQRVQFNKIPQLNSYFRSNQFGIVQQRMVKIRRQYHGRGKYGSCITASSGFVAARFP